MSSFNLQQHEIAVKKIYRYLASSALAKEKTQCDRCVRLGSSNRMPQCSERDSVPRNVCSDKAAYEAAAKKLASLFAKNFATYEGGVSAEVKAAGPNV